jgi:hypothetical protein
VLLAATAAAASLLPAKTLRAAAYIEVTVAGGTTGSGTVTVIGTDTAGAALNEVLTYTVNATQQTTARFGTVTELQTSGLADEPTVATVEVRAVSADGTPQLVHTTVATSVPTVLQVQGGGTWATHTQGTHVQGVGTALMDYDDSWAPQVGDLLLFTDSGETWQVRAQHQVRIGYGVRPHHHKLGVERYDV